MLGTIQEEAERLNRFIGNLLDMTLLESWPARPDGRSGRPFGRGRGGASPRRTHPSPYEIQVELQPGLPMLNIDMVLFEQVLFNLLDNAAKYSAPGLAILIRARRAGGTVRIRSSTKERAFRKPI